jgi:hypothetical protein
MTARRRKPTDLSRYQAVANAARAYLEVDYAVPMSWSADVIVKHLNRQRVARDALVEALERIDKDRTRWRSTTAVR